MTFKDYVNNLNQFLKENPELAEAKTIYASDDEGNSYREVIYYPSCGEFTDDNEFHGEADTDIVNAVCIN